MTRLFANIDAQEAGPGEWEVMLDTNNPRAVPGPRRLALCTHKADADDIVTALRFAHIHGVV